MFAIAYNFFLVLLALSYLVKGLCQPKVLKKYQNSLKERLGIILPSFVPKGGRKVIWIHAVSLGETRAIIPLFETVIKEHPDCDIVVSSTTETGYNEAKKSLKEAQGHFFLPLDLSSVMKRLVRQIRPDLLILSEGDFWYNMLRAVHEQGGKICLVNGKLSERSLRRFLRFPFFSRPLFEYLDLLCVQSKRYQERFSQLITPEKKIVVTGNLKFDISPQKMSSSEKNRFFAIFHIPEQVPILTIGSTHSTEEELLLDALLPVWEEIPNLHILLVPRHPERFSEVAALLKKRKDRSHITLIDAMGQLNFCYQVSTLAIVGGSFVPYVGGHNLFEPLSFHVPVLFGPYCHSQLDLVEAIKNTDAGRQLLLTELAEQVIHLMSRPAALKTLQENSGALHSLLSGATALTYKKMKESLMINHHFD